MMSLKASLIKKKQDWETIYPQWSEIFTAFNETPFPDVKVIILGQDPYHGVWQAHWLSFSVQEWVKTPPSLKNIYKEIASDTWIQTADRSGNLLWRAKQWVLLLNAILTVTAKKPASHHWLWWEKFTDTVISLISDMKQWCVFLLRWKFAQSKSTLIDASKHYILKAPHPSPFSAHTWFFWCKHFSKTNEYLLSCSKQPIDR